MKFFIIQTTFKFDEVEETITRVAQSTMRPLACQAEVAQGLNRGTFEYELFSEPCFENNGLITYPSNITEISEDAFDIVKEHVELYTLENDETDLGDTVKDYLAYLDKAHSLWAEFSDVPINSEDEIEENFLHFEIGTDRFFIGQWFESKFNLSVVKHLAPAC